jgi:hypothetical protein
VLVNNTEYTGESFRPYGDFVPVTVSGVTSYYSERPEEGATEVWEIVNMTADAHPIHLHLTQFQLVNRQRFDVRGYGTEYAASFPGGIEPTSGTIYPPATYISGFGPPFDYRADRNPAGGGKAGGNPDVTPYLRGPVQAAARERSRMEGHHPGHAGRGHAHRRPLGATSLPADTPQADADVRVQSGRRARLRVALPHHRSRGQRDDAPDEHRGESVGGADVRGGRRLLTLRSACSVGNARSPPHRCSRQHSGTARAPPAPCGRDRFDHRRRRLLATTSVLRIGSITLPSRLVCAPLAEVTHSAFRRPRRRARRVRLQFTEMLSGARSSRRTCARRRIPSAGRSSVFSSIS